MKYQILYGIYNTLYIYIRVRVRLCVCVSVSLCVLYTPELAQHLFGTEVQAEYYPLVN